MGHGGIHDRQIKEIAETLLTPGPVNPATAGTEGAGRKDFPELCDSFFKLFFREHCLFLIPNPYQSALYVGFAIGSSMYTVVCLPLSPLPAVLISSLI